MRYLAKAIIVIAMCLSISLMVSAFAEEAVWENENYTMTLDKEKLLFSIARKNDEYELFSAVENVDSTVNSQWANFLRSSISIEYAEADASTVTRTDLFSANAKWTVEENENGFSARVDFCDCAIEMTFSVVLEQDGFSIEAPLAEVREYGDNLLCSVYLIPAFGATYMDSVNGYLFIPEGSGAIINYSDGNITANTPYSKQIYGENIGVKQSYGESGEDESSQVAVNIYPQTKEEQTVLAPIYGFVHSDEEVAALCVLGEGADNAHVTAYAAGIVTPYNYAYSCFVTRDKYFKLNSSTRGNMGFEKDLQERNLQLHVLLLEGETADYSGMAQRYRRYLLEEEGMVEKQKEAPEIRLDILGAETKRGALWNSTIAVTTLDQTEAIVDAAMEAGISNLLVNYQGWQKGGMTAGYGAKPTALESSLGSTDELYALAERLNGNGGKLKLHENLLYAYTGRGYARNVLARKLNLQEISIATNQRAFESLGVLTPATSVSYAQAMTDAFKQMGFTLDDITNHVFSYSSANQVSTRKDTIAQYQALFSAMQDVAMVSPIAEYWAYADAFMDMPIETESYTIISEAVPFLPMVLDGLVTKYSITLNSYDDIDYLVLKNIENATNPSWVITASDGSVLKNTNQASLYSTNWDYYFPKMKYVFEQLQEVYEATAGSKLTHHRLLSENLVELTYENGTIVYLNYSTKAALAEDCSIEPMSWKVKEGSVQ